MILVMPELMATTMMMMRMMRMMMMMGMMGMRMMMMTMGTLIWTLINSKQLGSNSLTADNQLGGKTQDRD